jgi:hypothetical protein
MVRAEVRTTKFVYPHIVDNRVVLSPECHRANPLTRQTHKGLATKFIATLRELSVVQFKPVLERENSLHTTAEIFRAL